MKRDAIDRRAGLAEVVDKIGARMGPVAPQGSETERRAAEAHQVAFVDAEKPVKLAERRQACERAGDGRLRAFRA